MIKYNSLTCCLFLSLVFVFNSCSHKQQEAHEKPNILFIMTDQQGASMMSSAGNEWLKTPAADGIAAEGIRFTRSYATNPVCVPSRFSLQTGLFPSEIGMRANVSVVDTNKLKMLQPESLGNVFRRAGYQTYYSGKTHLPATKSNIEPWGYDLLTLNARDSLATTCADFLLHRKKGGKPFLLFASFINPHDISLDAIRWADPHNNLAKIIPPEDLDKAMEIPEGISEEEFFEKYCPPLPANHQPMIGETSGVAWYIKQKPYHYFQNVVRQKWTDKDWRMHRWAYMRLTERVDAQMGIVMDALKKSGLSKNTIVVFTSDHGENDGSHKLEAKGVFYEESINTPLLISYPWMKEKGVVDSEHLVSNGLDLLPTLCDLANIKPPSGLPGRSLVPLIDQKKNIDWRKHLFIENMFGYMIHTGRYGYELDDKGENREMFVDLKVDPGETRNLINDPKYQDEIDTLRSKLITHLTDMSIYINPPAAK